LGSTLLIVSGAFLLPPSGNIIRKQLNIENNTAAKWGIFLAPFIVGFSLIESASNAEVEGFLPEINNLIKEGKTSDALSKAKDTKSKYTESTLLDDLINDLNKFQSNEYRENTLVELTDDEFGLLKNKELEKTFLKSNRDINNLFIDQLFALKGKRAELKSIVEKRRKEKEAQKAFDDGTFTLAQLKEALKGKGKKEAIELLGGDYSELGYIEGFGNMHTWYDKRKDKYDKWCEVTIYFSKSGDYIKEIDESAMCS